MKPANVLCALALAAALATPLTGCGSHVIKGMSQYDKLDRYDKDPTTVIVETNYYAADEIVAGLRTNDFPKESRIVQTNFVNLDSITETSSMGRLFSEQVGARLAQRGFPVVDLKNRQDNFFIDENGEFALTRQVDSVDKIEAGEAVLTGTYRVIQDVVFVQAKVIRLADNAMIGGHSYQIPITPDTREFITGQAPEETDLSPSVNTRLPGQTPAAPPDYGNVYRIR